MGKCQSPVLPYDTVSYHIISCHSGTKVHLSIPGTEAVCRSDQNEPHLNTWFISRLSDPNDQHLLTVCIAVSVSVFAIPPHTKVEGPR